MKSITVALVFALAIAANCGLLKNVPQRASVLSLAEIDQHPLGKSLLSFMSLHMKAEGALEDLGVLLQQIHDDVVQQNNENEARHAAEEADCTDRRDSLQGLIYGLGQEFSFQTNRRLDNEEALVTLRPQLEAAESDLEETNRRISEGTAERERRHALFESDLADNVDAIEAVKEALALLNSMRAGTSFVQLKGRMQKVQARLENTKSSKHTHIYTPLLKALAQITSKADREGLARIVDLLTSLQGQLETARGVIQSTEDSEAASWETELAWLTSEVSRLTAQIANLTEDIGNREDTVEEATERQDVALTGVQTETHNLIDTNDECAAKVLAYENLRDELGRETVIIEELQNHFNTKLAGLNEYIGSAPAL